MKTNAIILAIVVGISQGPQPIIGFNYGARQYHRGREAYLLAVKWNLVVSTIAFIAFQFFPQSIISLFGDGNELYFEFAVLFMRTYLFMVLVNGVQLLSSSFFTAIGNQLWGKAIPTSTGGLPASGKMEPCCFHNCFHRISIFPAIYHFTIRRQGRAVF